MGRPVIIHSKQNIFRRLVTNFSKQKLDQIWRAIDLFKCLLQSWTKGVACHSSQRDVGSRPSEAFRTRKFNRQHAQPLEVAGMTDATESDPIINLKNFPPVATEGQQQDALAKADADDWASSRQFRVDVFAAIGDSFDPTIRFFDHAICDRKSSASFSSGTVSTPDCPTILIIGKILPCLSIPPVAVSASAAVSNVFNAREIASSLPLWRSGFLP